MQVRNSSGAAITAIGGVFCSSALAGVLAAPTEAETYFLKELPRKKLLKSREGRLGVLFFFLRLGWFGFFVSNAVFVQGQRPSS